MRLFAAVAPPAGALAEAGRLLRELADAPATGRGVRFARPEGLHATLHFFGDVPAEDRGRVEAALAAGAAGQGPFDLALEGLGAFPSAARPRVVWIGAAEPGASRLAALQASVSRAVGGAGFALDARPFHPHVTVGRVPGAPPPGLQRAIEAARGRPLGGFRVDAVTLFESVLAKGGSRYTPLARWRLAGD